MSYKRVVMFLYVKVLWRCKVIYSILISYFIKVQDLHFLKAYKISIDLYFMTAVIQKSLTAFPLISVARKGRDTSQNLSLK